MWYSLGFTEATRTIKKGKTVFQVGVPADALPDVLTILCLQHLCALAKDMVVQVG